MANETDFPTRGKVIKVEDDRIVFAPSNTTYELELVTPAGRYDGPVNTLVEGVIRAVGRKMYTVPSGGGWITPIHGNPRVIQGHVHHIDDRYVVINAGAKVLVKYPEGDGAISLSHGPLRIGSMVNFTLLPGSTFEFLGVAVLT